MKSIKSNRKRCYVYIYVCWTCVYLLGPHGMLCRQNSNMTTPQNSPSCCVHTLHDSQDYELDGFFPPFMRLLYGITDGHLMGWLVHHVMRHVAVLVSWGWPQGAPCKEPWSKVPEFCSQSRASRWELSWADVSSEQKTLSHHVGVSAELWANKWVLLYTSKYGNLLLSPRKLKQKCIVLFFCHTA